MQKLLFVCYGLGTGGIERCLVNLLNTLPQQEYSVDLLVMNEEYASCSQIRFPVHYIEPFQYVLNTTQAGKYALKHWSRLIPYFIFRLMVKLRMKSPWKIFKPLKTNYDIAIAYSHHDYSPYYVANKVKAKKKILWYHTGKYDKSPLEHADDLQLWMNFDSIVTVSIDAHKLLNSKFPSLSEKFVMIHNIIDKRAIAHQADNTRLNWEKTVIHIVTVGRLTEEKGPDIAVETCRLLVAQGHRLRWHWVGDGNQRQMLEILIRKYHLESKFILEGNKENPYPFIKNCDIYVQTSRFEGYCTTITEAKILARPIVTTDVPGMREQLEEQKSGLLTPVEPQALATSITKLIDSAELRRKFILNLRSWSNDYHTDFTGYKSLLTVQS